ncbi:hypothetical protein PCANC_23659 [Puccinia coronata f. sp. avenae]|uniref:Uncharacterized protein n=1 Tax=Puccinia coronata f. sp. avenae TaxID=200324 RepID=A0A2N5TQQ8_9BASI|nr:hypothetical protein PCANC_23659 [Puccinia coronata f. sp. avenae]
MGDPPVPTPTPQTPTKPALRRSPRTAAHHMQLNDFSNERLVIEEEDSMDATLADCTNKDVADLPLYNTM